MKLSSCHLSLIDNIIWPYHNHAMQKVQVGVVKMILTKKKMYTILHWCPAARDKCPPPPKYGPAYTATK